MPNSKLENPLPSLPTTHLHQKKCQPRPVGTLTHVQMYIMRLKLLRLQDSLPKAASKTRPAELASTSLDVPTTLQQSSYLGPYVAGEAAGVADDCPAAPVSSVPAATSCCCSCCCCSCNSAAVTPCLNPGKETCPTSVLAAANCLSMRKRGSCPTSSSSQQSFLACVKPCLRYSEPAVAASLNRKCRYKSVSPAEQKQQLDVSIKPFTNAGVTGSQRLQEASNA